MGRVEVEALFDWWRLAGFWGSGDARFCDCALLISGVFFSFLFLKNMNFLCVEIM